MVTCAGFDARFVSVSSSLGSSSPYAHATSILAAAPNRLPLKARKNPLGPWTSTSYKPGLAEMLQLCDSDFPAATVNVEGPSVAPAGRARKQAPAVPGLSKVIAKVCAARSA